MVVDRPILVLRHATKKEKKDIVIKTDLCAMCVQTSTTWKIALS